MAGDWSRLAAGMPFRTHEWLGTWWRHYQPALTAAGRHVELYVVCVHDGDELIGLAPWYADRSRTAGTIIRQLGSGEVCSDYVSVLYRQDRGPEVAAALANWLDSCTNNPDRADDRWDILACDNADAGDGITRLLAEQMRFRGASVHRVLAERTWRIELPPTFDEYLGRLSKSHRKQLRQLQRRYFQTGRAILRSAEHADQVSYGWQLLVNLHQRRLRSLGKLGCFQSEPFTRFHRAATEALFRAGRLRLHWLELDGRPVSAEYHLAGDGVVYAYLGGIEPDVLTWEPGRMITLATIQQAIAAGCRAFDFCRGDEAYKAHFRAMPFDTVTWRIVCNRPAARLRHSVWIAQQRASQWVKDGWRLAAGRGT
jgi:CelD/BcsL family acetyltransferase involved in cellulose biosynthesis